MARLLLAVLDRVEFPLDIVKGESPDFVLRGNDRYAGVEVTEASSRAFNQAQGNANRAGLEGGIDPGLHRWQDESQTPPKLRKRGKRHEGRPISFGWNRDEAETEWARCVRARIDDKVALLSSSTTYTRFDMNWLVVYDNLQVPEPKLDRALALLGTDIGEFDAVFVLTGGTLIVIERGATRRLPAPSL